MKLNIPQKFGAHEEQSILIERSLVIIGANGSGKTRFGAQIEKGFPKETHRVSAQKSLMLPEATQTSTIEQAENDFFYGTHSDLWDRETHIVNKESHKWKGNSFIQPLDDFPKLMRLLFTYELDNAINENPLNIKHPLNTIKNVWESIIINKKLKIEAGLIRTIPLSSGSNSYNASQMSDGERVIFYLIGQVVCAQNKAIIIIDEPEMHLHKSISISLWNAIEETRPDCKFIYLTHDLEIAVSRKKSQIIWLKEYHGNNMFDYEFITGNEAIPDQLYLELLGSRQPVLFIEGDLNSLDFRLYSKVFKGFTIKPVGPCSKVDELSRSFRKQKSFHNIESFGLVDRDRRTDEDIKNFKKTGILITNVAESENFFLLENVVKTVARYIGLNEVEIFQEVKDFIFNELKENLDKECLEFTSYKINQKANRYIRKSDTLQSLNEKLDEFKISLDPNKLWQGHRELLLDIIENKDYDRAVENFNGKNLIYQESFHKIFGLVKPKAYEELCLSILEYSADENLIIFQEITGNIINYSSIESLIANLN